MENRKISKVKRLNLRSVYSKQTMCRICSWSWDIKELDCLVHMMDHRLNTWGSLDDWRCIHKLPKKMRTGGKPGSVLSFILSKWTGLRDSANYSHGINIGDSQIRRDEMLDPKLRKMEKFPKSGQNITRNRIDALSLNKRRPRANFKLKMNRTEWNLLYNSDVGAPSGKIFSAVSFLRLSLPRCSQAGCDASALQSHPSAH